MRVTGSELLAFERCPEYRRNLYQRKRIKPGPESEALALGKWAHSALANMMVGIAPGNLDLPWFSDHAKARALRLGLLAWWDKYSAKSPWDEVILVEEPLVAEIGQVRRHGRTEKLEIAGIPDAFVTYLGKLWHCQHKTLDQSQSIPNFASGVAQSLHESIYAILGKRHFPDLAYGGTMLNIVRKLSEKAAIANASTALHLEFIQIGDTQTQRAIHDITWAAEHFDENWRRRSGCVEVGRGKCPYYESCWEGINLADDNFYCDANPDERYLTKGSSHAQAHD